MDRDSRPYLVHMFFTCIYVHVFKQMYICGNDAEVITVYLFSQGLAYLVRSCCKFRLVLIWLVIDQLTWLRLPSYLADRCMDTPALDPEL